MPLVSDLKQRVEDVRRRRPFIDHVVRTVQHYGAVNGNGQAGAITYFAFLSFFPLLLLAFAVIGYVSYVYPDARENLVKAINGILPRMIGDGRNQISLDTIESAAAGIAGVGLATVLYTGLGWISNVRLALLAVFERADERPSFVAGKAHDLLALVLLGVTLLATVAVSGVVTSLSEVILEALGLDVGLKPVVWLLALVVALAANSVLFYAFFRLLGEAEAPKRSLWSGAVLGAVLFEVLKQLSRYLIAGASSKPSFAVFGIALVLLVWFNYFSRVVVLSAAWAFMAPGARAQREAMEPDHVVQGPSMDLAGAAEHVEDSDGRRGAFAAGAAAMLGLVALMRRLTR